MNLFILFPSSSPLLKGEDIYGYISLNTFGDCWMNKEDFL